MYYKVTIKLNEKVVRYFSNYEGAVEYLYHILNFAGSNKIELTFSLEIEKSE